jgi:hypothetical protein
MMVTPLVLMLAAPGEPAPAAAPPPMACHSKALDKEGRKRQQALLALVRSSVKETQELPDGFALRLPADARLFRDIAEWVSLERKCCGFVDYAIEWKRDDSVWVKLTGAAGTKEALAAEMGLEAPRR